MTTTAQDAHGEHEHPKFLAHHFDTPQQQFDSGKLGTWLFLTTEVLLFSGLFCAYAVYRAMHPEIFEFAHQYLNKWLGCLNTLILIFSSFTMAWGVRAAQLGQKKLCVSLLGITILCGAGFMVVKGVEYATKFREELYPGAAYNPKELPSSEIKSEKADARFEHREDSLAGISGVATEPASQPALTNAIILADAKPVGIAPSGYGFAQSKIARASLGPAGLNPEWLLEENAHLAKKDFVGPPEKPLPEPNNAHIFFGIYFLMTGLHGIHVLAGMSLIGWIMYRANKGEFGPHYYSPVDFVGLYWHIVDLVWIFLFPLLYLIT